MSEHIRLKKGLDIPLAGAAPAKIAETVAPDLVEYIMERDYVSSALRAARDYDAGEEEWRKFIEDLKNCNNK